MGMLSDLAQFGLGAALIAAFFIPFVFRLYGDIKQLNKDHALEVKELNGRIEAEKDARRKDAEDFYKISVEQSRTSSERTEALMTFFNKLMPGGKSHE